jgi:hypothetical protein
MRIDWLNGVDGQWLSLSLVKLRIRYAQLFRRVGSKNVVMQQGLVPGGKSNPVVWDPLLTSSLRIQGRGQ